MAVVTIDEICRILAGDGNEPITKPRITQLVKEGMPIVGRNQYDPIKCMFWYIGKLRRSVKARQTENDDGSRSSIEQERKRLIKAQADIQEVERAKALGLAMSTTDHERILSDMVQEFVARIRAVPARVAPDVVGETSRTMIQAKFEKGIDEALGQVASKVPRFELTPSKIIRQPKKKAPKKAAAKKKPAKA